MIQPVRFHPYLLYKLSLATYLSLSLQLNNYFCQTSFSGEWRQCGRRKAPFLSFLGSSRWRHWRWQFWVALATPSAHTRPSSTSVTPTPTPVDSMRPFHGRPHRLVWPTSNAPLVGPPTAASSSISWVNPPLYLSP